LGIKYRHSTLSLCHTPKSLRRVRKLCEKWKSCTRRLLQSSLPSSSYPVQAATVALPPRRRRARDACMHSFMQCRPHHEQAGSIRSMAAPTGYATPPSHAPTSPPLSALTRPPARPSSICLEHPLFTFSPSPISQFSPPHSAVLCPCHAPIKRSYTPKTQAGKH
jgi:hypothetical protein